MSTLRKRLADIEELQAFRDWLLFGLTAAFLFAVIDQFGLVRIKREHDKP